MQANNIKLITIDFWNTLYDASGGEQRNKARMRDLVAEVDKQETHVTGRDFHLAIEASWQNFEYLWKEKQVTPSTRQTVEFIWDFLKLKHNDASLDNLETNFANGVLQHPPLLIEGVKDNLKLLHGKFKLAIISDTGFSPGSVLKKLMAKDNILQYFASFSYSDVTGVAKPHPDAFHTVLNALSIAPEHSLHIGDIEHTDIKGASNLGMHSIRFDGNPSKFNSTNTDDSNANFIANHWDDISKHLL